MPPHTKTNIEPDLERIRTRAANAESHPGNVLKPRLRRAPGVAQQEQQDRKEAKEKKRKDKEERMKGIESRVEEYRGHQQAALDNVEERMPRQKSKGTNGL